MVDRVKRPVAIMGMAKAPVKPRNYLYAAIFFLAVGILMVYNGSEMKYTLIGFIPAVLLAGVFAWAYSTEKRF